MNRIITIDREFGSGGREIGKRLSDIMNIKYYDDIIVDKISEESSMSRDYIDKLDEKKPEPFFQMSTAVTFEIINTFQVERNVDIYVKLCDILKEIAEKTDSIIVGRCADYILRDYKPFRIFAYADMEHKIKRCKKKNYEDIKNLSDKEIEKKIISVDKDRRDYYNFYTNQEWGDRNNYDLCINTSNMDIIKLTESLKSLIEKRY